MFEPAANAPAWKCWIVPPPPIAAPRVMKSPGGDDDDDEPPFGVMSTTSTERCFGAVGFGGFGGWASGGGPTN